MAHCLVRRAASLLLALLVVLLLGGTAHATILTVTSTADAGDGSLRATIAAAGADDTVFLLPRPDHYLVTSAPIVIDNKPLTIQGVGAGSSVIDGGGVMQVFRTTGTTSLTVSDLTITRAVANTPGASEGGAAIHHGGSGALTVAGAAFSANTLTVTSLTNNGGAAIWNGGGALSISGSSFSGNAYTQTAGQSNNGGGAVYTSGTLTVSGSSFTGNSANVTSTNSNTGGGAIFDNGGSVSIDTSSFTGNSATLGGGLDTNNGGGALFENSGPIEITDSVMNGNSAAITATNSTNGGGAVFQNGGNTTLTRSSMDANELTLTGGTTSVGGGGLYSNGGGVLTLSQSSVSGNSSATGGATGSSGGGGIYDNSNVQAVTITNSTLSGNSANPVGGGTGSGGGAYRRYGGTGPALESSTIAGNSTNGAGGGVLNDGTGFSLKNTIVAGNSATTGANCAAGTVTSQGNNIDDGTSCALAPGTDKPNTNPLLGPLGDHGGGTDTQMLLGGSPAIGAGAACPLVDQRGVARPQVGACDIGAVEVEPPLVSTTSATSLTPTGARLGASVEPRFSATAVRFQYGKTTGYGTTSASSTSAAAGTAQAVSVAVGGLTKNTLYHFRAVGSNATGVAVIGQDKTFRTPSPVTSVSKFGVLPSVFAVGRSRTPTSARRKRVPRGSSFRYTLSQASVVRIRIYRLLPGRKVGRRCRAPSRKLRKRKKCTRAKRVGTLVRRKAKSGKNKVKFSGRIGRKALKRGRYKATITATAPGAPRASKARTAKFRIVRR